MLKKFGVKRRTTVMRNLIVRNSFSDPFHPISQLAKEVMEYWVLNVYRHRSTILGRFPRMILSSTNFRCSRAVRSYVRRLPYRLNLDVQTEHISRATQDSPYTAHKWQRSSAFAKRALPPLPLPRKITGSSQALHPHTFKATLYIDLLVRALITIITK